MDNDFIFQVMSEKELAIQNKVLAALDSNLQNLAEKTRKRIKAVEEESKLKIAFVGQHNAGKSTIVSALTKNKSIKISSNVETDETASYEWNDVLLYDTPGLYAGVKSTHDDSALEAIKNSDILIFCITSSLFDDLMIENFVDLAYTKAYKRKIVLVVNKMSQEDAPYEELKENYLKTLRTTLEEQGGNLADFSLAFIDAKDYKDGIDDEDDELVEISHFDSFISLLNEQISSRGLLAKIGTKCNILLDAVGEAIASTGTEMDQNMMVVLDRTGRTIRRHKKEMKLEIERLELDLRGAILDIGSLLTDKIGVSEITVNDQNEINAKIEAKAAEYISKIEKSLSEKMAEMDEEIEDDLSSEIGSYVFENISTNGVKSEKSYTARYSDFVANYGDISKMLKQGSASVVGMSFADGASSLTRVAASSGTQMHKIVLNVGHFFGAKFKPWGAVKIANKIGKVASIAGPVLAIADVVVTAGTKIVEEKRIKDIKDAKKSSFNSISSIASDINGEIEKQYALMEAEAFDKKMSEINAIKESMAKEAGENNDFVNMLRGYSEEIKVLLDSLSNTGDVVVAG